MDFAAGLSERPLLVLVHQRWDDALRRRTGRPEAVTTLGRGEARMEMNFTTQSRPSRVKVVRCRSRAFFRLVVGELALGPQTKERFCKPARGWAVGA
jgi:hypothetical protein